MQKKPLKGDPFGFSNNYAVAKHQKIKGDSLAEKKRKKGLTMSKKTERGTLYSLPVLYVTRKKRKTFLVQFARDHKIF